MSLSFKIQHSAGCFSLDLAVSCAGPVTALFGPSGAGKTSVLNILAGLIRPRAGQILFQGETWLDSDKNIFVPAHARAIGYVFQEGRLFPHLNVRDNLNYGANLSKDRPAHASFDDVVDLLGLSQLLHRHPRNLSGGEQQRVAIGRALLARPRLLLMDEPLAALDVARRDEIMPYLENLRATFALPTIYVSHSMPEVRRLADEIITLEEGRVTGQSKNEHQP